MKYKRTKAKAKEGVLFLDKIVTEHGSVYRPVHEEDDVGIDGFIELVNAEIASGRLIAVQVKSGDSYLSDSADEFVVNVDEAHLKYWLEFMVPVILVCYSPSKKLAAWMSIRDYVEHERYHDRWPVKQIRVPFSNVLDVKALSKGIAALAHARSDERILLKSADLCLSGNAEQRHQGFQILVSHPDSRPLKVTCLFARRLLNDEKLETVKDALFILGFGVGRRHWSWNPNNREESDVIRFACDLCRDLSQDEIYRLLVICDDQGFRGPQGLGGRLFDVICCCFETAEKVLDRVVADKNQPIRRRANALDLLFECDDDALEDAKDRLLEDADIRDVVQWMFQVPGDPMAE
jgi:Domain of unknown function (DUF4365)